MFLCKNWGVTWFHYSTSARKHQVTWSVTCPTLKPWLSWTPLNAFQSWPWWQMLYWGPLWFGMEFNYRGPYTARTRHWAGLWCVLQRGGHRWGTCGIVVDSNSLLLAFAPMWLSICHTALRGDVLACFPRGLYQRVRLLDALWALICIDSVWSPPASTHREIKKQARPRPGLVVAGWVPFSWRAAVSGSVAPPHQLAVPVQPGSAFRVCPASG